jgi:sterol desaturase/sphingolipid hydroxylase (fatty acid hydroxylase superfamily)
MKSVLFGPRRLPNWWLRFTDANPAVGTLFALTGLVSIAFLLAPTINVGSRPGHSQLIELIAVITKSESLMAHALSLRDAYHQMVPAEVRDWVRGLLGNVALYFVMPFLLLIEYLFPCNPNQPLVSKGFLQDAVWFAVLVPMNLLFLGAAYQYLDDLYANHLAFLTIRTATVWPVFVQAAAALIVGEFLHWYSHCVRHKLSFLWLFHSVHHSQKEMNVFTDDRGHFVDRFVSRILMFIPFFMFQVPSLYAVSVIGLYVSIHSRFVHSNAKIDLGWFGWFLASPQFHRVHHSVELAHADKNYGGVLSVFDHLFGTAVKARDVYPETGIADARFPAEDRVGVAQLPGNWLLQTMYPFTQVMERTLMVNRQAHTGQN